MPYPNEPYPEVHATAPEPASPPRRRFAWPWILAVATALVVGFGIGVASSTDSQPAEGQPAAAPADAAPAVNNPTTTTTTTTTPPPILPKPEDFTVTVRVLEKKCFGSAGCNVTYQIEPSYIGTTTFPTGKTVTVIYEVSGGEELQTNRFTVKDGTASFPSEETIQTPKASSELTVKVTEVFI